MGIPAHILRIHPLYSKNKKPPDFDATAWKYPLKKSVTEGMGLIRAFYIFEQLSWKLAYPAQPAIYVAKWIKRNFAYVSKLLYIATRLSDVNEETWCKYVCMWSWSIAIAVRFWFILKSISCRVTSLRKDDTDRQFLYILQGQRKDPEVVKVSWACVSHYMLTQL